MFRGHAPLDHGLAQTYHNTPATAGRKQSKAKISAHAEVRLSWSKREITPRDRRGR
ncbi:hypothetical protein [Nocardia ignorata]|uniref:Uncharacterized protein n=1 Tax=Nocardia ignorata TaxID=145285 RepID=A0A4V3CMZ4_NOCIG|nr:hypothetical protein [Nocardia ignorata]TDP31992.1 hypothetical protein DFR75_107217 [Nocardia ignorata]